MDDLVAKAMPHGREIDWMMPADAHTDRDVVDGNTGSVQLPEDNWQSLTNRCPPRRIVDDNRHSRA
jgi:hypothetical protein